MTPDRRSAQPSLSLHRAGMVEWFRPGERERVEATLEGLAAIGIGRLRTAVSWADFRNEEGPRWYDWLLPYIAKRVELLPCFSYTAPIWGVELKTSSPPDRQAFADFLDIVIDRYGNCFEWADVWPEPDSLDGCDRQLDPDRQLFSSILKAAARRMHRRGKRTLLGGMRPADAGWFGLLCERGLTEHIDAVGLHAFADSRQPHWKGWAAVLAPFRQILDRHGSGAELWITETGYSTWDHREVGQVPTFMAALESGAERVYWYSYRDPPGEAASQEGLRFEERRSHTGIVSESGRPKLLFRTLETGGIEKLKAISRLASPPQVLRPAEYVLITGGGGFVGSNLADRLAAEGRSVLLYDALARDQVENNVQWLMQRHGSRITAEVGDVRDAHGVRQAVRGATQVFHMAAQVAVTCSVEDPATDFEINARGTFNVLEAIRARRTPPPLFFTSTNKVYGAACTLADLSEEQHRYRPLGEDLRKGFGEDRRLDLHSPYGCSKGAGDQYVLDYARIYDLPTVVFRMSCIYGPRQFGTEDQGWVAHFLRAALTDQAITLYGTGKQVRDLLFVGDLVEAFLLAEQHLPALRGRAFNIGGGPNNAASLLEIIGLIEDLTGLALELRFAGWRPGDQPWYVSDTRAFSDATGWRPRVGLREGVLRLSQWLSAWTGRQLPTAYGQEAAACASH